MLREITNRRDRDAIRRTVQALVQQGMDSFEAEQVAVDAYREVIETGEAPEGYVGAERIMGKLAGEPEAPTPGVPDEGPETPPLPSLQAARAELVHGGPGAFEGLTGPTEGLRAGDLPADMFERQRGFFDSPGWMGLDDNVDAIAQGFGRHGPRYIPNELLNMARQEERTQSTAEDALGALVYHWLDSATMGLSGLITKRVFGMDMSPWEHTETDLGSVAKWAGTLLGFITPVGLLGVAGKGVQAAARVGTAVGKPLTKAQKVGVGIGKALEKVDVVTPKVFRAAHKATDILGTVGVRAKVKKEISERTLAQMLKQGVDPAEAVKIARKAERAAVGRPLGGALGDVIQHKKWANPSLLKESVEKGIRGQHIEVGSQRFVRDMKEKLSGHFMKTDAAGRRLIDEDLTRTVLADLDGIFRSTIDKFNPRSFAERFGGSIEAIFQNEVATKWGNVIGRMAHMVFADSVSIATHGVASRTFHALAEPEIHGIDPGLSITDTDAWAKALGFGVKGPTDDYAWGIKGDILYGAVLGGAALYKGLIPILGRKANRNWGESFREWVGGPANHKMERTYSDAAGDAINGALTRLKRIGDIGVEKKLKNPLALYKRVKPDLERINNNELAVVGDNFARELRRVGGRMPTDLANLNALENNLGIIKSVSASGAAKDQARKEITGALNSRIEGLLGTYRHELGKDLLADLTKNVIVGGSIAVFGGGKQLYEGWQAGEIEFGNIMVHLGFSIMAAQDPFWNAGHTWTDLWGRSSGWKADRKHGKYARHLLRQDVVDAKPDLTEMPGFMGRAVWMNRLKHELRSVGVYSADYNPITPPNMGSLIAARSLAAPIEGVTKELSTKLEGIVDRRDNIIYGTKTLEGEGVKIMTEGDLLKEMHVEGRTARDVGDPRVTHDEVIHTIEFLHQNAAMGVRFGEMMNFGPDNNIGTAPGLLKLLGVVKVHDTNLEVGAIDWSSPMVQYFAEATRVLRDAAVKKGFLKTDMPLTHETMWHFLGSELADMGGPLTDVFERAANVGRDWQRMPDRPKLPDDALRPVEISGLEAPAEFDRLARRYNNLLDIMRHTTDTEIKLDDRLVLDPNVEADRIKLESLEAKIEVVRREMLDVLGYKKGEGADVDFDSPQTADFLARVLQAHTQEVAPSFLLRNRKVLLPEGNREFEFDFNTSVLNALQQVGAATRREGTNQFWLLRPDYANITREADKAWIQGLYDVLVEMPQFQLLPTEAGTNMLTVDKVDNLLSQSLVISNPLEGGKPYQLNNGLRTAFEASGIDFRNPFAVRSYRDSLRRHTRAAADPWTVDFMENIAPLHKLIGWDDRRGRVMKVPLIASEGLATELTPDAFLAGVRAIASKPSAELSTVAQNVAANLNRLFDLSDHPAFAHVDAVAKKYTIEDGARPNERAVMFARIVENAMEAGYINGFAVEPVKGAPHRSDDAIMRVLNPQEARQIVEAIDSYIAFEKAETMGPMIDHVKGILDAHVDNISKKSPVMEVELQQAMLDRASILSTINHYFLHRTVPNWRKMVKMLSAARAIDIKYKDTGFKFRTELNEKQLAQIVRAIKDYEGADVIAMDQANVDAASRGFEAGTDMARRYPSKPQDGVDLSRTLDRVGLDSREFSEGLVGEVKRHFREVKEGLTDRPFHENVRETMKRAIEDTYVTDAEKRDFFLNQLDRFGDVEMLGLGHQISQSVAARVWVPGNHIGSERAISPVHGLEAPDPSTTKVTSLMARRQARARNQVDVLSDLLGVPVEMMQATAEMGVGGRLNLRDPRNQTLLTGLYDAFFHHRLPHLVEGRSLDGRKTYEHNIPHRADPANASLRKVLLSVGGLDNYMVFSLPSMNHSTMFRSRLSGLINRYSDATYKGLVDTVEYMRGLEKLYADNVGKTDSNDAIYEATRNDFKNLRRTFELMAYDHVLGEHGAKQWLFRGDQAGNDAFVKQVETRMKLAYGQSHRMSDVDTAREAFGLMRKNKPDAVIPGADLERGTIRVLIADDVGVDGRPVTWMDGASITHQGLVDLVYHMQGIDSYAGDVPRSSVKANLFQHERGPHVGSTLSTKTEFFADPWAQSFMGEHGITQIISRSAAKLMFGDYANAAGEANFRLANGSVTRDLREVRRALAAGQRVNVDPGSIREVSIEAVRFQSAIDAKPEWATVTAQNENWMSPVFSREMVGKFFRADHTFVQDFVSLLASGDAESIGRARALFQAIAKDHTYGPDSMEAAQFVQMMLDVSPHAGPHMGGNRRAWMGMLKKFMFDSHLFRGKSRSGTKSETHADHNNTLKSGESVAADHVRELPLTLQEAMMGINHHSMEFDAVATRQAETWGFRGENFFNDQGGQGDQRFTDMADRRSKWGDYKVLDPRAEKTVLYNALMEFASQPTGEQFRSAGAEGQENGLLALSRAAWNADKSTDKALAKALFSTIYGSWQRGATSRMDTNLEANVVGMLAEHVNKINRQAEISINTRFIADAAARIAMSVHNLSQGNQTIGKLHDAFTTLLANRTQTVDGEVRDVGYQYDRRFSESGLTDPHDGLTGVSFGITGVAQRSPSNKPNDTVPIHMLGFEGREAGNTIRLSYDDAIKIGEADFDKDPFNYWFNTPHRAMSEVLRMRNVATTGELTGPKTMSELQSRPFEVLTDTAAYDGGDRQRYGRESREVDRARGAVVNAKKTVWKALNDQMILRRVDGDIVTEIVPVGTLDQVHRFHQGSIAEMDARVQSLIDSKGGFLDSSLLGDQLGWAVQKFFRVRKYRVGTTDKADPQPLSDPRLIEALKVALRPYQAGEKLTGETHMGDRTKPLEYDGMVKISSDIESVFGRGGLHAKANIQQMLNATLRNSKVLRDGEANWLVDMVHQPTSIDYMAETVLRADRFARPDVFSDNDTAVARALRESGVDNLTQHVEDTGIMKAAIPEFIGERHVLENMIKSLMRDYRNGDESAIYELQYKQNQLMQMLRMMDSGELYKRPPREGYEMRQARDRAVAGAGWKSALNEMPDPNPSNAGNRSLSISNLRKSRANLYRLRSNQLVDGEKVPIYRRVSDEYIQQHLETMMALNIQALRANATDAFNAQPELTRFFVEMMEPTMRGESFSLKSGEKLLHYDEVPWDLMKIAYHIAPVEGANATRILANHMGNMDRIFSGDVHGLMNIAKDINDAAINDMNVGVVDRQVRSLVPERFVNVHRSLRVAHQIYLAERAIQGMGVGQGLGEKPAEMHRQALREHYGDNMIDPELAQHPRLFEQRLETIEADRRKMLEHLHSIITGDPVDRYLKVYIQQEPVLRVRFPEADMIPEPPRLTDDITVKMEHRRDRTIFEKGMEAAIEGEVTAQGKDITEVQNRIRKYSRISWAAMRNRWRGEVGAMPKSNSMSLETNMGFKNDQLKGDEDVRRKGC